MNCQQLLNVTCLYEIYLIFFLYTSPPTVFLIFFFSKLPSLKSKFLTTLWLTISLFSMLAYFHRRQLLLAGQLHSLPLCYCALSHLCLISFAGGFPQFHVFTFHALITFIKVGFCDFNRCCRNGTQSWEFSFL